MTKGKRTAQACPTAWHEMPNLEAAFAAGNQFALLLAIRNCARWGQPIPSWAARGFDAAFLRVYRGECGSWDDVLGRPHPRKHLPELASRRALLFRVYDAVEEIRGSRSGQQKVSLQEAYELVGEKFGIKKTLVGEWHREGRKIVNAPVPTKPGWVATNTPKQSDLMLKSPTGELAVLDASGVRDRNLILNLGEDPDPLLDCDDPVLSTPSQSISRQNRRFRGMTQANTRHNTPSKSEGDIRDATAPISPSARSKNRRQ